MTDVKTTDNIEVKEKLTNQKPWFNGAHTFSSVKVNPPQNPPPLGINVSDSVNTKDKLV